MLKKFKYEPSMKRKIFIFLVSALFIDVSHLDSLLSSPHLMQNDLSKWGKPVGPTKE